MDGVGCRSAHAGIEAIAPGTLGTRSGDPWVLRARGQAFNGAPPTTRVGVKCAPRFHCI